MWTQKDKETKKECESERERERERESEKEGNREKYFLFLLIHASTFSHIFGSLEMEKFAS